MWWFLTPIQWCVWKKSIAKHLLWSLIPNSWHFFSSMIFSRVNNVHVCKRFCLHLSENRLTWRWNTCDFDGSTDKRNNILGHLGEQDNFDLWNAKVHLWLCCMYLYDEHLWSTALSPLFPPLLTLEAQAEGVNGQPGLKVWNQIGACTSLLCSLLATHRSV